MQTIGGASFTASRPIRPRSLSVCVVSWSSACVRCSGMHCRRVLPPIAEYCHYSLRTHRCGRTKRQERARTGQTRDGSLTCGTAIGGRFPAVAEQRGYIESTPHSSTSPLSASRIARGSDPASDVTLVYRGIHRGGHE